MAQALTGTRSRLTGWLRQRPSRVLRYRYCIPRSWRDCAPRSQRSGGDGKTLPRPDAGTPSRVRYSVPPLGGRCGERGDSLVELAIILPVLLLILFAILDLGRAVYAYHVVANCAREGARFGRVSPGDTAGIIAVVQNAAVGLDAAELAISVSHPTADNLRVDVHYTFRVITPLVVTILGRDSLVLHNASTMYTGY